MKATIGKTNQERCRQADGNQSRIRIFDNLREYKLGGRLVLVIHL